MGKAVLLLTLLACYSSNAAEIGVRNSRLGQFNTYFLYTTQSPHDAVPLPAPVGPADKFVVLVHDHVQTYQSYFNTIIKYGLFNNKDDADRDVNVLVVDWSLVASQPYDNAVVHVPSVATNLRELITDRQINVANLHMVGFGLGAHIVALAARGLGVARITGLDPSRVPRDVSFEYLKRTDARFVEVIHTNGNGVGMAIPLGTADFYPNGGNQQPGCTDDVCNHRRSYELFAASMYEDSLIGRLCSPQAEILSAENCRGQTLAMGTNALMKYGSGRFFLETDIQIQMRSGQVQVVHASAVEAL